MIGFVFSSHFSTMKPSLHDLFSSTGYEPGIARVTALRGRGVGSGVAPMTNADVDCGGVPAAFENCRIDPEKDRTCIVLMTLK